MYAAAGGSRLASHVGLPRFSHARWHGFFGPGIPPAVKGSILQKYALPLSVKICRSDCLLKTTIHLYCIIIIILLL